MNTLYTCNWKYWLSFNLAVWPQTGRNKYWRNLNLAVAPAAYYVIINVACLSGSVPILSLLVSRKITNLQLAICTVRLNGCWAGPRVLLPSSHITSENNIGGFNFVVSTLAAKLPILIPRQIFRLYSNHSLPGTTCKLI